VSLLNKYSTPAERQRGCRFAERFEGPTELAKNGGTISGSVTWMSNGLQFNTASTQVPYSNRNCNLTYAWPVFAGVIEFTPSFAVNDSVQHTFAATTNYHVFHSSGNDLSIGCNSVYAIICTLAEYQSYWIAGGVNRIAWSCVSGANYLYLNGVLIKSSNTAWTAATNTNMYFGNITNKGFTGIMHSAKFFTPQSTAQALTPKDCEVLSAGTTYTYWKDATCIMDGLSANYDPVNYRHLDISGNGNHVLLGNGAGTGTPTKLATQGYSCNGTTQYFSVPLAAWPGAAGTILMDVSATTNTATIRLFGTDHSSGNNYEVFTSLSGSNNRVIMGTGSSQIAVVTGLDKRFSKIIVGCAWATSSAVRAYTDALLGGTTAIGATTPQTPDTAWWLMRYDASYLNGVLRSFLSFSRELSSIQVADATLWMQKLRNRV